MNNNHAEAKNNSWPTLSSFPLPAKAWVTMVILTMAMAMVGALGQIIVHDIIPTFFSAQHQDDHSEGSMKDMQRPSEDGEKNDSLGRGDLFADAPISNGIEKTEPIYLREQFVWTLKWSHIHLFGMSMIFIFMGAIAVFLDISPKGRAWLIVLPFIGVLVDIATVWLKGYISPAFFWLHIPGGGLFGTVFFWVSGRAFREMWTHATNDEGKIQ